MSPRLLTACAVCALSAALPSRAQESGGAAPDYVDVSIERIQVIGESVDRSQVIGSATRLNEEDLLEFKYQDIHRLLREVPGVNIREEDGFGLRPNIGLRGSGADRSAKITLMEDGVLIAPAPYASPSAYYFPTIARMTAVEVRKGSSSIKFGPRTVGGAVNLVSRSIPDEALAGFVDLRVGEDGLVTGHTAIGGSTGHIGGLVEVFRSTNDGFKQLPSGRDTGFDVEDYLVKFRLETDRNADVYQALHVKLSHTVNDSNETYLGLTDADFDTDPYQRYAASDLDRIDSNHDQYMLTHVLKTGGIEVVTTGYYNDFKRDWFKFHDLSIGGETVNAATVLANPGDFATELGILRGEIDSDPGAVRLRHNAREYYSAGVQSLVAIPFATGEAVHDLEFSVRYHEDEEDRAQFNENFQMLDGTLVLSEVETVGRRGNRVVSAGAWAFMMQDTITLGRWTIVPGVRFETIDLRRVDFAGDDPDRSGGPTGERDNTVNAFIPGLGVNYQVNDNLTLTAGVFKGFNPPGPSSAGADEEKSINYEVGAIFDRDGLYGEAVFFYNDYDNILGTCTESTGCRGGEIGDQFNGGEARILGLEFLGGYAFGLGGGWQLPVRVTYTFTDAEFETSFSDDFFGDVEAGDSFPDLPKHQLTASLGVTEDRFRASLQMNYLSAARSRAGSGDIPSGERLDDRVLFDVSANYFLLDTVELFATVRNLFDETYVAGRLPIGARPGLPRTAIGGVRITF